MAREKTLTVVIAGDAKGAVAALNKVKKETDSFGDKLGDIGGKMTKFGKKMTVGVTLPAVAAAGAAFKMAGDMNETMSKATTIFGDYVDGIVELGDRAATTLGMSRQEAIEAAGNFGNLFTQLGVGKGEAAKLSSGLVGLAADFASFHNALPQEALEAVTSAFRGEYDAVQRFVPTINAAAVEQRALAMTGKELTKELTDQDKALAVNALLFEGAGKAAGDFARTSDSAANKQKILTAQFKDAAATIGQKLIPIGMKLMGWATDLIDKFSALSPKTQDQILLAIAFAAALGPVVGVLGNVFKGLDMIYKHPIITGLVLLTAAVIYAYQNWEWFRDAVDAVGRWLEGTLWPILQDVAGWISENFPPAVQAVSDAFSEMRRVAQEVWSALAPILEAAVGAALIALAPLISSMEWLIGMMGRLDEFKEDPIGYATGTRSNPNVSLGAGGAFGPGMNNPTHLHKSTGTGGVGARASGGPVWPGTWLVGERGPELLTMGGRGHVTPNSALGGVTVNVTVNAGLGTNGVQLGREIMTVIDQAIAAGNRPKRLAVRA